MEVYFSSPNLLGIQFPVFWIVIFSPRDRKWMSGFRLDRQEEKEFTLEYILCVPGIVLDAFHILFDLILKKKIISIIISILWINKLNLIEKVKLFLQGHTVLNSKSFY